VVVIMKAERIELTSTQMPHATPVVFVVDDDVSVRESLELRSAAPAGSRRYSRPDRSSSRVHESAFRAAWSSM